MVYRVSFSATIYLYKLFKLLKTCTALYTQTRTHTHVDTGPGEYNNNGT